MRTYAKLQEAVNSDVRIDASLLSSDMSIEDAFGFSLRNSIVKKFIDDVEPDADKRCLDKFLACNERCRGVTFKPNQLYHDLVLGEFKSLIESCFFETGSNEIFQHTLRLSGLFRGLGVGAGASIGCESYDFYTKLFNSSLTGTNAGLYAIYRQAISSDPTWYSADRFRSAHHGERVVDGSILSFVAKTRTISRSICTEPVLNMLLQKWIGSTLERVLNRKFGINLSKQPDRNREMARLGSIYQNFGTIDLESASDSISRSLCKEFFPRYVVNYLDLARCPLTVLPDGTKLNLDMVSSMGNGFTFPLQTLIFACLVNACYRVMGIKPRHPGRGDENYAVFGDDIIVRSDAYEFVVSCLELFGFRVNVDKSFNAGHFRESCGHDYYRGRNIRGVYLKSLESDSLVYSGLNRLLRWTASSGILLTDTVSVLSGFLGHRKVIYVPYKESDSAGLKVPKCYAKRTLWCHSTFSVKYRYLCVNKLSYSIKPMDRFGYVSKLPGFLSNPDGLLEAFIGGYIRNGRVSVRLDTFETKVRWKYDSSWDYIPAADLKSQDHGWYAMVGLHLAVLDRS